MRKKSRKNCRERLFAALLICIVLVCCGCGKKEQNGAAGETDTDSSLTEETEAARESAEADRGSQGMSEDAEAADETARETPEDPEETDKTALAAVRAETGKVQEQRFKNPDNETLLAIRSNQIKVTIEENQEAEEAVNRFFEDRNADWRATVETYREMAERDLSERKSMEPEPEEESGAGAEEESPEDSGAEPSGYDFLSWSSYKLGRIYRVMRADEEIISIVEDSYEYRGDRTGGDYVNEVRVAYNFDARTGERMWLEDVASDLDEIRQKSTEYMGQRLSEPEVSVKLYDDYANHLEDILTDSTWYTDWNGFHIICNEYIITPHSEGILDFLLPYGEVDVVKQRFQLAG